MKTFYAYVIVFTCVFAQDIKQRISIQKCKEYGQNIQKPCITGDENLQALAKPKEFPHLALIGHGTKDDIEWFCSGSLISNQYVLSAAHCAASIPLKGRARWIRLGELDVSSTTDDAFVQNFNIGDIIIHPNYTLPSVYNDIALFKLDRPVEFSGYISPACLAGNSQEINENQKFIISGWGEEHGEAHKHLKQDKNIEIIGNKECNKAYESLIFSKMLNEGVRESGQLCGSPSTSAACQIKSGAPLQYRNKEVECMYNIVGVSSAGLLFCGSSPDIYTRVQGYLDWIENIVWKM